MLEASMLGPVDFFNLGYLFSSQLEENTACFLNHHSERACSLSVIIIRKKGACAVLKFLLTEL